MEEDYAKRILKVLVYIEDHILDEITIDELARVACYSFFHFQRVFRFIVGESVHKYIRRLRLERARKKLRDSDQSITEIALDADFDTPSAFTKAFKQCVGRSPRNYRNFYKEMKMANNKFEDLAMIQPHEIKNVPEVPVLFIRKTGNYDTSSKEAWDAILAFIKENNLDETKLRYFSMGHDDAKTVDEDKLRYDVCIQIPEDLDSASLHGEAASKVLKGGKYAIFICRSPIDAKGNYQSKEFSEAMSKVIRETFDRIFLKWFPDCKENYDGSRLCYMEHSRGETTIYVPLV